MVKNFHQHWPIKTYSIGFPIQYDWKFFINFDQPTFRFITIEISSMLIMYSKSQLNPIQFFQSVWICFFLQAGRLQFGVNRCKIERDFQNRFANIKSCVQLALKVALLDLYHKNFLCFHIFSWWLKSFKSLGNRKLIWCFVINTREELHASFY